MSYDEPIAALRLSLASPAMIRSWSFGEVTRPETINHLTLKPEPDGLFCERIFGPTKDWSCFCGRYKRQRTPGMICERCGVELTQRSVRRSRMGHIELAVPVAHPWFAKGTSSIAALLLDLSPRQLTSVLSYSRYLVTQIDEVQRQHLLTNREEEHETAHGLERMLAGLKVGDLLEESAFRALQGRYCEAFCASTGAEGLDERLRSLDLDALSASLRQVIRQGKGHQARALRRLQVVEAFRISGLDPSWMILSVIPVLPPDLRPLVPLEGGRFATSDLNSLYQRIIHRNDRLKHFLAMHAPGAILNNEKRLLQAACDALFDNRHASRPICGPDGQPLKSLTDLISGKQGRFRRHLLGKRVDYSGRSVISVGVELHLHQCGLPTEICLELFKPFLIRQLLARHLAPNERAAKRMIEGKRRDPVIWDLLEEAMHEKVVLLNRAPTLHRLSIQAFEAVRVEGHTIHLHPLVCSAFNADFDGDQMAVHLPLSDEAQAEARALLLSTRNLRSPASGEPSLSISQDMVLGLFFLTQERPSTTPRRRVFADGAEAQLAYEHGIIGLHTPITVRLADPIVYEALSPAEAHQPKRGRCETTVGRLIFNDVLPERLRYRNYSMTKERLKQLISESLSVCGAEVTAKLADDLKRLGFAYATRSGISFAISDIEVPTEKQTMLQQAEALAEALEEQYHAGMITEEERYRQLIELWNRTTEQISKRLEESLDPFGSLATIIQSGATKAKFQQIRQLSGIRGLMTSPSGQIIAIPVKGNYLEGLKVWEIFIAASGARKGFMDRSLNTAMSGYLTRKLVEAGLEVWITEKDCGTTGGVLITHEDSQALGFPDMRSRISGRVLAERLLEAQLEPEVMLDDKLVDRLLAAGVSAVRVRSPLTCQAHYGICQLCYGEDLATKTLVRLGTAVGVIAGQSIGEPGTQLTMRTFHSGGIANAQGDITQGLPRVIELFEARVPRLAAPLPELAGVVKVEKDEGTGRHTVRVTSTTISFDEYSLPEGSQVLVEDQAVVSRDQLMALLPAEPGSAPVPVVAQSCGLVTKEGHLLTIRIEESEERSYAIPAGRPLSVVDGQKIEVGTPLAVGPLDPQEVLRVLGRDAAQHALINEVQRVYRGTGVYISEKHVEVIVRQMLRFVQVSDAGDTELLAGEIVDRFVYGKTNACVLAEGGAPALAHPVLLGLTKAILQTRSWLAAASFQETSRVLARAAIRGACDDLRGFKERLIVGKRIPTGSLASTK